MKKLHFILAVFLLLAFFGCKENKILSPDQRITEVQINMQGLQNLGADFWYEAWIIYEQNNSKVYKSIGVFTVDDNGVLSQTVFDVNLGYLQLAKGVLISIEQDSIPGMYFRTKVIPPDSSTIDTIKAPSSDRILAATIAANDGNFLVDDPFMLKFDFSAASGTYLLATPTDSTNADPKRGLWFVNKDTTVSNIDSTGTHGDTTISYVQGLNLPVVPSNWHYEGWVKYNGTVLPTGNFTDPGAADDSLFYGDSTGKALPFPGDDFLVPDTVTTQLPPDLSGLEIGINLVPPYPPKANPPFLLVPLKATIPANAQADKVYRLENNTVNFPQGQLKLKIDIYE